MARVYDELAVSVRLLLPAGLARPGPGTGAILQGG
jgi:hypothetical protein